MAEYIIQETNEGEETRRFLTDDEVCERLPHQVVFSAGGKARADGKTPFTIHLQITSAPLADDSRRPIGEAKSIPVILDGESFVVETDEDGHGVFECAFAAAGTYVVTTDSVIYSAGLTIEAV